MGNGEERNETPRLVRGSTMFRSGMIYHDEYIVESFSTTTKQSYYILLSDFQIQKTKRELSQINNALHLYLRNQGVVEKRIKTCAPFSAL